MRIQRTGTRELPCAACHRPFFGSSESTIAPGAARVSRARRSRETAGRAAPLGRGSRDRSPTPTGARVSHRKGPTRHRCRRAKPAALLCTDRIRPRPWSVRRRSASALRARSHDEETRPPKRRSPACSPGEAPPDRRTRPPPAPQTRKRPRSNLPRVKPWARRHPRSTVLRLSRARAHFCCQPRLDGADGAALRARARSRQRHLRCEGVVPRRAAVLPWRALDQRAGTMVRTTRARAFW